MKKNSYKMTDIILDKTFLVPTLECAASIASSTASGCLKASKENRLLKSRWKIQKIENKAMTTEMIEELFQERQ